jgi:hypothetical protein
MRCLLHQPERQSIVPLGGKQLYSSGGDGV